VWNIGNVDSEFIKEQEEEGALYFINVFARKLDFNFIIIEGADINAT